MNDQALTTLHRVTWVDEAWPTLRAADLGHPSFVPVERQRHGRFDNNTSYAGLYLASSPVAAVAETFHDDEIWLHEEIVRPSAHGAPRCLVSYQVTEGATFFDFDDAGTLLGLGLRPSEIVGRDRDRTQRIARDLWGRRDDLGIAGLTWWSYVRPQWAITMAWSELAPRRFALEPVAVEPLTPEHPAVIAASQELMRRIEA